MGLWKGLCAPVLSSPFPPAVSLSGPTRAAATQVVATHPSPGRCLDAQALCVGLHQAAVCQSHPDGRNSECKGREREDSKLPKLKDHLPVQKPESQSLQL